MEELILKKEKLCEIATNSFISINNRGEFEGPLMALLTLSQHVKTKTGVDSEVKAVDGAKGTLIFKLHANWSVEFSNRLIRIIHYNWVIE